MAEAVYTDSWWLCVGIQHDLERSAIMKSMSIASTGTESFGTLLRQLRRRAGMTQGELAALVGFSLSQISHLERGERLPDLAMVSEQLAPALGLAGEPRLLQRLVELAALARGERPPAAIRLQRTVQATLVEESMEEGAALPAALTPLLGRQGMVEAGAQRLSESPGRLLTLLGPPGVGKTRLALAIAALGAAGWLAMLDLVQGCGDIGVQRRLRGADHFFSELARFGPQAQTTQLLNQRDADIKLAIRFTGPQSLGGSHIGG